MNAIRGDRRGQSFIEAMVALTIIVSSVSSSLALVQSSLTSTRISGSQIVAANLAREGLEVVRSLRDSNWLAGRSFSEGLIQGTVKTARPILDATNGTWSVSITDIDIDDDAARVYLFGDGTYVQADALPGGASVSQYRRLLNLDHICRETSGLHEERVVTGTDTCSGAEETVGLAVTSVVSFIGLSGNRRVVEAEERLYDWR